MEGSSSKEPAAALPDDIQKKELAKKTHVQSAAADPTALSSPASHEDDRTITEQHLEYAAGEEGAEFFEIEYFSGDKYYGELQGQNRHGMGMFVYAKTGEKVLGIWKENHLRQKGLEHPVGGLTGELVPLAVMKYDAKKRQKGEAEIH